MELRTDWLMGRAVLIAENRALRPNEFTQQSVGEVAAETGNLASTTSLPSCPFCVGNESRTPPALYEKRDERGRWRVRVVPNMFPAVMPADATTHIRPVVAITGNSPTSCAPAIGEHEVIIESNRHISQTSALSTIELYDVLEAYAARLRHLREQGLWQYGLVFKNQGRRAGASMAHLHSQLVALPFVPPPIEAEHKRAAAEFSKLGSCPYCRLIERERLSGERIILERDGFVALCPFASWQPYEVWFLPVGHEPWFESALGDELDRLAGVVHDLIGQIEQAVPGAEYNLLLRTAPWVGGRERWSHWRIELLPRINSFAGFEVATGIHINHLAPERAALQLRPE